MEADAAPGPGGEEQEEEQWGGQVADRPLTEDELRLGRTFTEEERRVWEALPETAKRLSLDGIMSFDAHMVRSGCAGWGKSIWVGKACGVGSRGRALGCKVSWPAAEAGIGLCKPGGQQQPCSCCLWPQLALP